MKTPLQSYFQEIQRALRLGNATEHTYRPALKNLIESVSKGITATNEPKREKCGAPDYIVTQGQIPLGYVEAKDLGKSLADIQDTEQILRYREGLTNLILTDYLEFRWFVSGELRLTARLASLNGKELLFEQEGEASVIQLLQSFLEARTPTVKSPKELAARMAGLARLIKDIIQRTFSLEGEEGSLHRQMDGFRQVLLHDLTSDRFADMYAQTICYGLFAARCNAKGAQLFTRQHAAYNLPKTNPFLRKMFSHIAGPDLDERIVWAVDDLAELLSRADISSILLDFGKRTRKEDPVVHFYETFLASYDPKMREARGIYYTPEPVVAYITRSVDYLLKTEFELPDGLANSGKVKIKASGRKGSNEIHKVLILDPATGTGTFLFSVIDIIHDSFKGNTGLWSGYVSEHLLPRLFGFELLMAPYAVAHMKLGLQLAQSGYDFRTDERLRIYLTNTLEEAHEFTGLPLFTQWLAEEASAANQVKQQAPVMVILGNPPYSGHSANTGKWITELLGGKDGQNTLPTGNYLEVDGCPLGERNAAWLQDDYVKFIRFAQWRIERTGYGILGFITNHGYLDNPTFRGMRQSLMATFDDVYVLDLHGNSKRKERTPDGSKDENVFDIQQGVAIGIFVKRGKRKRAARVYHSELWGLREIRSKTDSRDGDVVGGKYKWLQENTVATTKWQRLEPRSPHYLFIPEDKNVEVEYAKYWKVTDIFPVNGWGIKSRKDYLLINFSRDTLIERFRDIRLLSAEEAIRKYKVKKSPHWNFGKAKELLSQNVDENVKPVLFRPFDTRYIYYEKCMIERGDHRFELMSHLFHDNLSFITVRRSEIDGIPAHFFCSDEMSVLHSISAKESNFVFPLYLYRHEEKKDLFSGVSGGGDQGRRTPNVGKKLIENLSHLLGLRFVPEGMGDLTKTWGPEDLFNYIYAISQSWTYRKRYAEQLGIDFPRFPLTRRIDLFRELGAEGRTLVDLHLTRRQVRVQTSYPIAGDNVVKSIRYVPSNAEEPEGRVWINKTQYFEGVRSDTWTFQIGGYQVAHKWLKDRKDRELTYSELAHYQNILAVIDETQRIMTTIDSIIERNGGWPLS